MSRHILSRGRVALALTALFALGLLLPGRANAQGSSATVLGTVTDASGAVVANAAVQVKNTGTAKVQQVPTDSQGRYTIANLPIGSYEVQATAPGFQTMVRRGITLTVGAQSVVDFSLPVGQSQQTVTVEGAVSQVDTVSSTLSANVEQKQISDLPLNGRNFTDLIALVPGIASGSQVGNGGNNLLYGNQNNFSVSGGRSEGQAYLLDNQDIQGFWAHGSGSGVMGTTLGIEAIAEFAVFTNTYSAQFGGNGAVVNTASKSGTNSFHGTAYEFLRNSALDARNFFDGTKAPPFRQNQFGGSIGGPIKKDKLFFFANDEELKRNLGRTVIALVPDANAHNGIVNGLNVGVSPKTAAILALYPLPTGPGGPGFGTLPQVDSDVGSENYLLGRVDYTLSDKDTLFFRYVRDFADTTLPFFGSPIAPRWPEVGSTRNQFATIEHRRIVSPTLVNLVRFSFTRSRETDVQGKPDQVAALDFFPERHQNGGVNITGLTSIGTSIFAPLLEVQNKFPIADDIIWTRGSHSLKFGGLFSRVQSNFQQNGWWGGFYTFPSLTAFLQGTPSGFQGPEPGLTDSYRDFRENEFDGYVHDEWKVLPKLTVNVGLRYEFVSNPHTVKHPINAILHPPFGTYQSVSNVFASNPSVRNFDPRVGVAFDPFKDHKTSIRAGAGIFFNPIRARSYASGYYFNTPYALAFIFGAPSFPNPFPAGQPLPPPAQLVGIDYNTSQTPRMYQWNVNIQRELLASTTLTVGYVGSRGVHLYANRDINPIQPSLVNGVTVFGVPFGTRSGFASNPRLNPAASSLSCAGTVGNSNYNSLQAGLNRRFTHGVQAQASYTWSKCMDNASGTSGLEGGIPWTYPVNGSFDRGRCQFDRPQVFKLSGVYALPFKGNRLVSGWQVNGGLTEQSGPPWNVIIGFDQTGNAIANQRPNIGQSRDTIYTGNINQYASPAAFTLPAPGTFGNLQRDSLHGPGISNLDFSASKETRIKEQIRLQFRAEFFNILNHANFSLPGASAFLQVATNPVNGTPNPLGGVPNGSFGKILSTTTNSRQIQFALKILF